MIAASFGGSALAAPLTGAIPWTGAGPDNNWATASNWTGNDIPDDFSEPEIAYFGGASDTFELNADTPGFADALQNEGANTIGNLNGYEINIAFQGVRSEAGKMTLNNGTIENYGVFQTGGWSLTNDGGDIVLNGITSSTSESGGVGYQTEMTLNNSTLYFDKNPTIRGTLNLTGASAWQVRNFEAGSNMTAHAESGGTKVAEADGNFPVGQVNIELNDLIFGPGSEAIQAFSNVNLEPGWNSGEAEIHFSLAPGFTPIIGHEFYVVRADADLPNTLLTPGKINGEFLNLTDGQIIQVGDYFMQADYRQSTGYAGLSTDVNLITLTVTGVIPEPATVALLGLGALALPRRRRSF